MTVLEVADMNRRYHTFFFDLDGTITDSEQGITNSVKYALNKFGIEEKDRSCSKRRRRDTIRSGFSSVYEYVGTTAGIL